MLDRFKIDVHVNSLGNFAAVGILWYDSECTAPNPNLDKVMYITPPNIIEHIFGITFARKVEVAKSIVTKKAIKHLRINLELNKELD